MTTVVVIENTPAPPVLKAGQWYRDVENKNVYLLCAGRFLYNVNSGYNRLDFEEDITKGKLVLINQITIEVK